MKILVDVDGVLADIHTVWLGKYNADYRDRLALRDITRWEMHELVKPECGMKIYDYLSDEDFYRRAFVIPGALAGVDALRQLGDVLFLTAGFFMHKVKWLADNGFICGDWRFSKDVIICQDKSNVRGDILIDDYPGNLQGFHGILFDQPWNRNAAAARAVGWADVVRMVREWTVG